MLPYSIGSPRLSRVGSYRKVRNALSEGFDDDEDNDDGDGNDDGEDKDDDDDDDDQDNDER